MAPRPGPLAVYSDFWCHFSILGDVKCGCEGPACSRFHIKSGPQTRSTDLYKLWNHAVFRVSAIFQYLSPCKGQGPSVSSHGRSDLQMAAAMWLEIRPCETYRASWSDEINCGAPFVARQYRF